MWTSALKDKALYVECFSNAWTGFVIQQLAYICIAVRQLFCLTFVFINYLKIRAQIQGLLITLDGDSCIRALYLTRPIFINFVNCWDRCLCDCWLNIISCKFSSYRHFFSQYRSSSARSNRNLLKTHNHHTSHFTSSVSHSATNWF